MDWRLLERRKEIISLFYGGSTSDTLDEPERKNKAKKEG